MPNRPKLAAIAVSMAMLWVVVYWVTPSPNEAVGEGDGVRITIGDPPAPAQAQESLPPETVRPVIGEPDLDRQAPTTLEEAMARVIPPEFGTYKVAYGDNAHTISRKLYGTSKYWQSVLKANALADPTRFREGQTIRYAIDPNNIQGIPVDADGEPIEQSGTPAIDGTKDAEYVVQRGDTLSGIAKSIYGRASMWRTIRDANRGTVNSEGTNIRAGMVLRIPPPEVSN